MSKEFFEPKRIIVSLGSFKRENQGYVRSKKMGSAKVCFKDIGKSDKNEKYRFFKAK
ncbi:MAG: hypothetical protein ABIM42_06060 [candidate division WOR-3 bacterium]